MITEITDITITTGFKDPPLDRIQCCLNEMEGLLAAYAEGSRTDLEKALRRLIRSGGKRIRPRITLLLGHMLGADPETLLSLAASVEMLHTASLVHDDLMDGALLRRGLDTINVRWDTPASVLAGDLAFSLASQLILRTRSLPVIDLFTDTLAQMVRGEVVHSGSNQLLEGRKGYYAWIHAKTAVLFELAAGAPTLLARAEPHQINAARQFGLWIGLAFQIVDDILDFTGDPGVIGKSVGSDLRQGTITLPLLTYQELHPWDPDISFLAGGHLLDAGRTEQLVTSIRRSGALDRCREEAVDFLKCGLDILQKLPESPERQILAEIASSLVS